MEVRYKISLVTYLDILGFKNLIATRDAGEISRIIGVVKQAVKPTKHKIRYSSRRPPTTFQRISTRAFPT